MIVGLCHGVFDILHFGHLRHLLAAAAQCDHLIVSITADKFVNKGPHRPVFSAEQRAELLRGLECVDRVVISESPDVIGILAAWKPHKYFKGDEYESRHHPGFAREAMYALAMGIEIVFTHEETSSSTEALERLRRAVNG